MQPKVLEGTMVLRQWDRLGLTENSKTFNSLDELYAYCLAAGDPEVVDRIVIRGRDEHNHIRVLTFAFQSITVSTRK
jgi:hypothetical protein